ncbi:bifunctional adenosylcobinamide kinase/adenosylcobinamide-phosphate guanylyltransferase [Anaeromicropila herbilytica]|uniref:Adenosylcobinamide kinase n=1 Tax=Anaeromicropila herbilytica TaxID=2785025 RepID=A0A7R7IFC8_9FIRM|nr:bifunctional adenosylcobinamide kinase/adenosylcobinamide-phosphate guanylyltransferase [Anaeromicropila herbilytica]BCN32961.1 adenosylcobinamide kinase/adenosylcobinamide phosphate guanyltransferase [Anaeromicropila herbilytica]
MFTLITGGSGSGKSEYAEMVATSYQTENRIYIATMFPFDEECNQKILRHKKMREAKNFHTIECYTGLRNLILPSNSTVLLDCLSNLVANERYQENGSKNQLVEEIIQGVKTIRKNTTHLVIVTNEVFSDGIEYDGETIQYLHDLGEVNCALAKLADEVIEIVYTIPIFHKSSFFISH